ncbi:MAG TPA: TonB-dependent receptor [Lysobacter sp.]
MRLTLSVAIATALVHAPASAQDTPAPATEADAATLDTVVVSGTARFKGVRKRDASFSITTASQEQLREAVPLSTADTLKIVPGIWVESAGGQTGANVFVRGMPSEGDAPFVTVQMDGAPLYPPSSLSFLDNASLFRIDDTIDRMEVLRGGSSPIFSNGQPGATVNYIQKKGGEEREGSLRLGIGSDGFSRVDLFDSGKLADGWFYSVGGFYRQTDGVRDPRFLADQGGQFSAALTHGWENGEFTVYARHTDDKNAFYTPIPLVSRNDGGEFDSFPGLDALTGTLLSDEFRHVVLPVGPNGETIAPDLGEGRGVNVDVFGASVDVYAGEWTISNRVNHLSGTAPTNALFTGANPQTLSSYIAGFDSPGTASYVNGGGQVDPDQQLLTAGFWVVDKRIESFSNDFRLSRDLFEGNTFTTGLYYARYSSADTWYLGNNMLLTAQNNARRINLQLADGRQVTRDGFASTAFFALRGDYDGQNTAVFVADEWVINERLRLDGGIRYEWQQVDGTVNDTSTIDLDGNPATLYDNATSISLDTARRIDQDDSEASWTLGLNYTLNDTNSVFVRANSGYKLPTFDNLRDGNDEVQQVDQYELGLKSGNAVYDLYLTAFHNRFTNSPFQAFLEDGSSFATNGDSRATGLEVEAALRPFDGLELALGGTWLDARYRNYREFSGNQVVRQPEWLFRFTPSYFWTLPFGDLKVFATYAHVGDRYADLANAQRLPSYQTLDVGANLRAGEHWEFALTGSNVSDELGLTEGNVRVPGAATSDGVFLGRPIAGHSYQLSAAYHW